jgi:hypothetical protein
MGPLMGPEAHLERMRHWRQVKVEKTAAAVNEVQNLILATDLAISDRPATRARPMGSDCSVPT